MKVGEEPAQELKEGLWDSGWLWLIDQVSRPLPREASNHPGLIKHHLWGLETEVKAHQGEGGDSQESSKPSNSSEKLVSFLIKQESHSLQESLLSFKGQFPIMLQLSQ